MIPFNRIFFHCLCVAIVIFTVFKWQNALAEDTVSYPVTLQVPPLVHSVQFKDDIYFCGIKIPMSDPEIRQRLELEMLLALWNRPQVILWLKRSTRYFPHIEKILKSHGLHDDLKYIPVVESALKPHSRSSRGAVGFWQFIRSTGLAYGLRIDSSVDERRNLFKSTDAACRYLKKLKTQFGSCLLAMAAYNMGEYGLSSEIKAQENNQFFSLYLPLETQRYVFKIVAVKLIMTQPLKYGFMLKENDYYPLFTFDRINFDSKIQLPITLIAKAAGVPFKTIKDMNPEIRGYHLTTGKKSVLIPKGRAVSFEPAFSRLLETYEKNHAQRFHVVRKGESLIAIARKYRVSLYDLLKWNNLTHKSVIHPGNRLVVSPD